MSLPDFLTGRTAEVLEVLAQSDSQTRDAVIHTIASSVRELKTRPLDSACADAAEHYGRLLRDFPSASHRELRAEALLDVARILFQCGATSQAAAFAQPALEWARDVGRPELQSQLANANGCLRVA